MNETFYTEEDNRKGLSSRYISCDALQRVLNTDRLPYDFEYEYFELFGFID